MMEVRGFDWMLGLGKDANFYMSEPKIGTSGTKPTKGSASVN